MPRRRWIYITALLALLVLSFAVRVYAGNTVVQEKGLWFADNDTVRRLERIENLVDPDKPYPYVNPDDGYPTGTELHWTLPMDWAILGMDRLVARTCPGAKRFELGALWIGVALGTIAVLAFALLATPLFGSAWMALVAAGAYALTPCVIHATSYGNGDHQCLQHLSTVVAILGFATGCAGRSRPATAVWTGCSLGLAMWVSTETMGLSMLTTVAAFLHVVLLRGEARRNAVRFHLGWAVTALAVVLVADVLEHRAGVWHFEWDKVSLFQAWHLFVFAGFLAALLPLERRMSGHPIRVPVAVAGASVLLLGAVPMIVPSLRAAFRGELESFAAVNAWVQDTVLEYRPLLMRREHFELTLLVDDLGYLAYGLPLWFLGAMRTRSWAPAARVAFATIAVGLFGFACKEVKLAHLFAITQAPLLVAGGTWCIDWIATRQSIAARQGGAARQSGAAGALARTRIACGLGAVAVFAPQITPGHRELPLLDEGMHEVTTALARLTAEEDPAADKHGVLAHWTHGAKLLHYGGVPVVASGYHRNLAGIHDSFRVLTASDAGEAQKILRARKVRFIVSDARPSILAGVEKVLPELGVFAMMEEVDTPDGRQLRLELTPRIRDTLMWYMIFRPVRDPRLKVVFESEAKRTLTDWDERERTVPLFRIWRVIYPEDKR